jgi:ATP/maltotriose-dependent transcriptional regulator MalT
MLVSLDSETRNLPTQFAESVQMTPEKVAVSWLELQSDVYQQDKEVGQLWGTLTNREHQIAAPCYLEYSDREIAGMLDITYGTARTHL